MGRTQIMGGGFSHCVNGLDPATGGGGVFTCCGKPPTREVRFESHFFKLCYAGVPNLKQFRSLHDAKMECLRLSFFLNHEFDKRFPWLSYSNDVDQDSFMKMLDEDLAHHYTMCLIFAYDSLYELNNSFDDSTIDPVFLFKVGSALYAQEEIFAALHVFDRVSRSVRGGRTCPDLLTKEEWTEFLAQLSYAYGCCLIDASVRTKNESQQSCGKLFPSSLGVIGGCIPDQKGNDHRKNDTEIILTLGLKNEQDVPQAYPSSVPLSSLKDELQSNNLFNGSQNKLITPLISPREMKTRGIAALEAACDLWRGTRDGKFVSTAVTQERICCFKIATALLGDAPYLKSVETKDIERGEKIIRALVSAIRTSPGESASSGKAVLLACLSLLAAIEENRGDFRKAIQIIEGLRDDEGVEKAEKRRLDREIRRLEAAMGMI
eukprot:GDKJ01051325.1.p1 GENE.GDKJ01051325.1~~GDKJ01051325.1.p1  ORF type:complete len:444 (-),score=93.02 GDKJ01051325.1:19-1320(-)